MVRWAARAPCQGLASKPIADIRTRAHTHTHARPSAPPPPPMPITMQGAWHQTHQSRPAQAWLQAWDAALPLTTLPRL